MKRAIINKMESKLISILDKAEKGGRLTMEEITFILELRQKDHIDALFNAACALRHRYFGNHVLLYGFLYISTYCRNNCSFCYYRVDNLDSRRYRKEEAEIIKAAVDLARSGVHLIDITMGEDPQFFNDKAHGFEPLIQSVKKVKAAVNLPIMVSPGVVPEHVLEKLAKAGASWFACYQETHNRELFKKLRPGQDYDTRFSTKKLARKYGLLIEEGILVGIGETSRDIANTIEVLRTLDADQLRAMNFVPQKNTPMSNHPSPDPLKELLIIALMRLVFPGKLIPATLDVEGLAGLKRRLEAGANVVTSIVPPRQGLAGVAQSFLDIDNAHRTTDSVLPVLKDCSLEPRA
ncbi:MAG: methylornithine synthase PylB [Candidatus Aminicenantes bacterium]